MPNLVLFDFDGLLANTFQFALQVSQTICPDMTEEDYRTRFEGNINHSYGGQLPGHSARCRHDLDFFDMYLPMLESEVKLFEGMREVVRSLYARYFLGIISSTTTDPIKEFLKKCKLLHQFPCILGNDIDTSKIRKIEMAVRRFQLQSEHCVFITDTLGDMHEATHAGVGLIGVSWGFHDVNRLRRGNPFRILHEPRQIPQAVEDYFSQNPE